MGLPAAGARRTSPFHSRVETPMHILANTVVTLSFDLYDADDTLLESTDDPIIYLHGGFSGMPPKLARGLVPVARGLYLAADDCWAVGGDLWPIECSASLRLPT